MRNTGEVHLIRLLLLNGGRLLYQVAFNPNVLIILKRIFIGKFIMYADNGVTNPPKESYSQGYYCSMLFSTRSISYIYY